MMKAMIDSEILFYVLVEEVKSWEKTNNHAMKDQKKLQKKAI